MLIALSAVPISIGQSSFTTESGIGHFVEFFLCYARPARPLSAYQKHQFHDLYCTAGQSYPAPMHLTEPSNLCLLVILVETKWLFAWRRGVPGLLTNDAAQWLQAKDKLVDDQRLSAIIEDLR
jgi:hypothetical protein